MLRLNKVILYYRRPQFLTTPKETSKVTEPLTIRVRRPEKASQGGVSKDLRDRLGSLPRSLETRWMNQYLYPYYYQSDIYNSLIFVFSDDSAFSLLELPGADEKYLKALPNGLRWPDLAHLFRTTERPNKGLAVWMSEPFSDLTIRGEKEFSFVQSAASGSGEFELFMSSFLFSALNFGLRSGVELGLCFSQDEESIAYFPVANYGFTDEPFFDVSVRHTLTPVTVGLIDDQNSPSPAASLPVETEQMIYPYHFEFHLKTASQTVNTPYFLYDSQSQSLQFRVNARERWQKAIGIFDQLIETSGGETGLKGSASHFQVSSFSLISVSNFFSASNDVFCNLTPLETQPPQSHTQIEFTKDLNRFQVVLDFPQLGESVHSLGQLVFEILKLGEKGLRYLLPYDGKAHLTGRAGMKRAQELKLLRHQGCAFLLAYEISLYLLNEPQSYGQKIANDHDFTEYIMEKWALLTEGHQVPLPKPHDLWNRKLISVIEKAIRDYLDLFRTRLVIFTGAQKDHYSLHEGVELKLLRALLEAALKSFGPVVFAKSSARMMKDFLVRDEDSVPAVVSSLNPEVRNLKSFRLSPVLASWSFVSQLMRRGFAVKVDGAPFSELGVDDVRSVLAVRSAGREGTSFFSLNPEVFFKGQKVDPTEFTMEGDGEFIRYKNEIYFVAQKNLPGIRSLMAFWRRLSTEKNNEKSKVEGRFVQIPRHRMLDVLALADQGVQMDLDEESARVFKYFLNLGKDDSVANKIHSEIELKPYQRLGIGWIWDLYQMNLGGILSDEMGLGKTAQVLGFLSLRQLDKEKIKDPCLIIVPTSLLHNWIHEKSRFFPKLTMKGLGSGKEVREALKSRSDDGQCVYVTTYGLMFEHKDLFLERAWDVVVFDEVHQLKNISAQRTGVARQLQAKFKLGVSGTPVENNLLEFYSLFDLVLPGGLGSLPDFRKRYVQENTLFKVENMQHLRFRSKPVLLRRTKKSVNLELPEKINSVVPLTMDHNQRKIYRSVAVQYNDEILSMVDKTGEASAQLHMLAALMRLRQICSHPGVIASADYKGTPPKFDYLFTMLPDIVASGQSILIFTQFRKTLDLALPLLKKIAPTYSLHGSMSSSERQRSLTEFSESSDASILIMTLKTGGVGLNLTKASYVFHLEPWWNPAAEEQATDRAHRLGQKSTVNVYRLIMQDSLEERMQEMKMQKMKLFAALMSENEEDAAAFVSSAGLTASDFKQLIGE